MSFGMIVLNQSISAMQNYAKTEDVYEDIADDVGKKTDTSNFEIRKPLPIGKNKKSDWANER